MSFFQASPSDAVKLLELCFFLYNNCLVDANRADRRYAQFKTDVQSWRQQISELSSIAHQYSPQTNSSLNFNLHGSSSQSSNFNHLVLAFNRTLDECDALIQEYGKLARRSANFTDNVWWGVHVQQKADNLRREIQFHAQKIVFALEPVLLTRVSTMQEDVAEILALLQMYTGQLQPINLPMIAASLDGRFRHALSFNSPSFLGDSGYLPLQEGLDTFYRHFGQSTVLWVSTPDKTAPSQEEFLNLIKAQWILDLLKKGDLVRKARVGSTLWRMLSELERRLDEQYQRCGADLYSEATLGTLDDAAFVIWPIPQIELPRALRDGNGREEKMLELSLSAQPSQMKQELVFFRVNEKLIRVIRDIEYHDPLIKGQESERFIHIHKDGLVPWYAIAETKSLFSVEVTDSKGAGGLAYTFNTEQHALLFQRAITGYAVRYITDPLPAGTIECTFNITKKKRSFSLVRSELHRSSGRIQLWHWSPLPVKSDKGTPRERSASSNEAPFSLGSGTIHSVLTKAMETSSLVSVQENDENNGVAFAEISRPPVLVAVTQTDKQYIVWYIELHDDIHIKESRQDKPRTVVESNGRPIVVHKMSVEKDKIGDLNLAIFGWPRHPAFEDKKIVEKLTCTYIAFDFPNTTTTTPTTNNGFGARDKFNQNLRYTINMKKEQTADRVRADRIFSYGSHRPNQGISATPRRSRASSHNTADNGLQSQTTSPHSSPPRISSISISPSLGHGFPWDVLPPNNLSPQTTFDTTNSEKF